MVTSKRIIDPNQMVDEKAQKSNPSEARTLKMHKIIRIDSTTVIDLVLTFKTSRGGSIVDNATMDKRMMAVELICKKNIKNALKKI